MADVGRLRGTVQWFSAQKGFGFVTPDVGGDDLFVHQTEIQSEGFRTLREGQRVEFNVDSSEDGRTKAVEVLVLARSYASGDDHRRGGSTARGAGRGRGGGARGGRVGGVNVGDGGLMGVECYNCGRVGHLARNCYGGGDGGTYWVGGGGRGRGGGSGGGGGGGGRGGRECYNCGGEGHFARECPVDHRS